MPVLAVSRPLIHIERESLLQLERSLAREWLETDGRGGYASSTVLLCPTRRYHGLLVAPPSGNTKRHVFLSRFEEVFHGGGKSFAISMARYPALWSPLGHQGIERFELLPFPSWVYQFGSARIERELLVVRGSPTVLVRYRVTGQRSPVELQLRPFLPYREADALTFENMELDSRVETIDGGIRTRPYPALPPISIRVSRASEFSAEGEWYRRVEYRTDIARGYEGNEDAFTPGTFRIALESGVDVFVGASIEELPRDLGMAWARESATRRRALAASDGSVRATLALGADAYLVRDASDRLGVIAGWPWFGEWGRDLFISLPGLTLARGEIDECRSALEGALPFLSQGLMPNIFGSTRADSRYNSVDASLWFVRAVRLYELAAGAEAVQAFVPALREIAENYARGTEFGIKVGADGLLRAGDTEHNLTWMDAEASTGPVTPRHGCAVELNALWYFLLAYLEELEQRAGDTAAAKRWGAQKSKTGASFLQRFWLAEQGYLADVWREDALDSSVRPNMVIAAALEWSPLSRSQRAQIVERAKSELLTPCGLRTLTPSDPAYQPRYAGGTDARDRAYHQGTVWPWLTGSYVEASLRAHGTNAKNRTELRALLEGFEPQLANAGLSHVSEVMDGDAPHRPGGTIAQAWNTAELLRAWRLLDEGAM